MDNNDVLKRLRYALNITDLRVVELFKLTSYDIPKPQLEGIFKTEEESGYIECGDELMDKFLDGLVQSLRGQRPGAAEGVGAGALDAMPRASRPPRLCNNEILKRIRIALALKDEDIISIMSLAGIEASKSELSALFRKVGHPNYRPCGDQFLRNFLVGLTAKYRG
jgi:uncharacterized protein YehS (DUF1456 family)